MASSSPFFPTQFFNGAAPAAAGKLYSYESGTTTPKQTFVDQGGGTPNTNPITLDQYGRCDLWLGNGEYTFALYSAEGALIDTWDDISGVLGSQLITDLQSTEDPSKGAGMVGYGAGTGYPAGTVGYALQHIVSGGSSPGFKRLKADYGLVGDGVADDTSAYVAAIAAASEGACLVYDGYFRITSTVTVNKRLNHLCFGSNQGVIVDVGSANDGVIFLGTDPLLGWGLNDMRIDLNVYGAANCCMHAVTFARADDSDIRVNIKAGATAYGLRLRGTEVNSIKHISSNNFAPPASCPVTAAMPAKHCVSDNFGVPTAAFASVTVSGPASPAVIAQVAHGRAVGSTVVFGGAGVPPSPFILGKPYYVNTVPTADSFTLSEISLSAGGVPINSTAAGTSCQLATCTQYASNDNDLDVIYEGGGDGFIQAPMPGEGDNTLRGQMQGLAGAPFYVESSLNFCVTDLRMEFNTTAATIKNSTAVVIGDGVKSLGDGSHSSVINIQNCRGYKLGAGYGKINIDSASSGGSGGAWQVPDIADFVCADTSFVQMAGLTNSTNGLVMAGGPGHPTMETLFVNPFFDIFDTVASSVGPPIGVTQPAGYTAADMILETGITYAKSTNATAMKCLSRGTTFPNAARVTPGVQPWRGGDWVSIHTAVQMLASTYKVFVYIFDGVSYKLIGKTKSSGVYETFTGSVQLIDGNNWYVQYALMNAAESAYVSLAQFYIAGLNVVKGAVPPAGIGNSLARMNYIGSSISNTPFRQGALAVNGGHIYQAVSNGSAGDWLQTST